MKLNELLFQETIDRLSDDRHPILATYSKYDARNIFLRGDTVKRALYYFKQNLWVIGDAMYHEHLELHEAAVEAGEVEDTDRAANIIVFPTPYTDESSIRQITSDLPSSGTLICYKDLMLTVLRDSDVESVIANLGTPTMKYPITTLTSTGQYNSKDFDRWYDQRFRH